MPVYPFNCEACGTEREIVRSIHKPLPRPSCCGKRMERIPQLFAAKFKPTIGRDSGVYALDYGRRATEDLTVPGKMARLKRDGVIKDPFDSPAPRRSSRAQADRRKLINETFSDATPAELKEHHRRRSGNRTEV